MKFLLSIIICSQVAGTCLDAGYKESIVQLEKIGAVDVNEKRIFIKFFCSPTQET